MVRDVKGQLSSAGLATPDLEKGLLMNLLRRSAKPRQRSSSSAPSLRRVPSHDGSGHFTLTACSICLRVLRGTEWVEAEAAIGELRSYERRAVPGFEPALCTACADSIRRRRIEAPEPNAAEQSDLTLIDFQSAILQLSDDPERWGALVPNAAA